MALPGINAREMRTKFSDVLTRYFAGDPSLVGEIHSNYVSESPINQFARASAAVPEPMPGSTEAEKTEEFIQSAAESVERDKKRRKQELYDAKVDHKRVMEVEREHTKQYEIQYKTQSQILTLKKVETEGTIQIHKEITTQKRVETDNEVKKQKEITNQKQLEKETEQIRLEQLKLQLSVPPYQYERTVYTRTPRNIGGVAPVPPPAEFQGPYTVEHVADFFHMLDHVSDLRTKKNILKQSGLKLHNPPYNLVAKSKVASMYNSEYSVNEYEETDVPLLKTAISKTRDHILAHGSPLSQPRVDTFMQRI